jgi:hypothetical protein
MRRIEMATPEEIAKSKARSQEKYEKIHKLAEEKHLKRKEFKGIVKTGKECLRNINSTTFYKLDHKGNKIPLLRYIQFAGNIASDSEDIGARITAIVIPVWPNYAPLRYYKPASKVLTKIVYSICAPCDTPRDHIGFGVCGYRVFRGDSRYEVIAELPAYIFDKKYSYTMLRIVEAYLTAHIVSSDNTPSKITKAIKHVAYDIVMHANHSYIY